MRKNDGNMICIFLLLLLVISVQGPDTMAQAEPDLRLTPKPVGVVYRKSNQYPGSEFLFTDWKQGELQLKNGQVIKDLAINYNAYSDEVVYKASGNITVEISKHQVSGFKVTKPAVVRSFILSGNDPVIDSFFSKPVFLELLYDGRIKLYARRSFKINHQLTQDNPFNKSVYYPEDRYYVKIADELIPSPQKAKSYLPYYDRALVRDILHSQHLTLKDESGLINFIEALDLQDPVNAGENYTPHDK
jgi:hypothetical protein